MTIPHRLQRCFKPRFAVIYPFGFFVIFSCSLNEASLRAGIVFIIAGLLIRLWSNGYAVKNDKLSTCGPYAFVRNPLYLGTFLIAIGFVIVLKSKPPLVEWIVGGIFLSAISFMYYRTIQAEQGMLLAKFKDAFMDYCKQVPAMVPCLVPYRKGDKWPFSLQRLFNSKEHKTVFWIFILLVVFHLKTRLILEHRPMNETSWILSGLGGFLILLDAAFEINKKKFQIKA
jgi:protein-S-isoprenylcysteine O-methyltransferase Ste14